MSVESTIASDINIAETWVASIASKAEALVTKAEKIEPAVANALTGVVSKTEAFLAAATPAVAGEGLNFPADSVAYAAFVALVGEWQSVASTIEAAFKAL